MYLDNSKKETKAEILGDIVADKSKIVAPNTVEYYQTGGKRVIRFHHTDILIFSGNTVRLSTGGWRTMATKDRFDTFLPPEISLHSQNGFWYVCIEKGSDFKRYAFVDGMVIDLKKQKALDAPDYDEAKKEYSLWQRHVSRYIDAYAKKLYSGEMPSPSGGDCWMCMIAKSNPFRIDRDHLISHVKEMYLVPSLIWAAAKSVGSDPDQKPYAEKILRDIAIQQHLFAENSEKVFFSDDREIRRILRRYFRNQFSRGDFC